ELRSDRGGAGPRRDWRTSTAAAKRCEKARRPTSRAKCPARWRRGSGAQQRRNRIPKRERGAARQPKRVRHRAKKGNPSNHGRRGARSCEDSRTDAQGRQGLTDSSSCASSSAKVAGVTPALETKKASIVP